MRTETKIRARALQLLYAWEMHKDMTVAQVAAGVVSLDSRRIGAIEAAEDLAKAVVEGIAALDDRIIQAADNWRLDRIGAIERNILRLGLHELLRGEVPPAVTISEAVRLAHLFAGPKAPAFVNGVLDSLARQSGKL
ncbi:MAG: transcription antitermination factor NusB [Gemmatimonadota bacterium]|nr:MAG: transcription antitermination factor NusB [Gemmatimonadota bacterium]